jgi:hypothetical protein
LFQNDVERTIVELARPVQIRPSLVRWGWR